MVESTLDSIAEKQPVIKEGFELRKTEKRLCMASCSSTPWATCYTPQGGSEGCRLRWAVGTAHSDSEREVEGLNSLPCEVLQWQRGQLILGKYELAAALSFPLELRFELDLH